MLIRQTSRLSAVCYRTCNSGIPYHFNPISKSSRVSFRFQSEFVCGLEQDFTMRRWKQPEGVSQLQLYNSLTREKETFCPQEKKRVSWYSCGPTVYDASHMGHARSYITFDILRRVMADYFNYDIFYVMNITDVDDKIILRARRNHLLKEYSHKELTSEELQKDVSEALMAYQKKFDDTKDEDKKKMMSKIIEQSTKAQADFANNCKGNSDNMTAMKKDLLTACKDPLSEMIDKQKGNTVTDHKIFSELTHYWENEFHSDMTALNVLPADVLTRVSQYVPEVVTYIEKIISNGYAYESNSSVYFNTMAFIASGKHEYAKLVPEAVGDLDALAEGEGALGQSDTVEKKSERDFALWKASKPGEPSWDSPWGKGRPGWHIECSVMASDVLGSSIDVHTGGVDLKFPHHDNELAQAEAHYGCDQWIHYFLHAGHLTIEGCKMAKSLKNFITIKDALKKNTSRQIRFAFLLHSWNTTLDYSTNVLREAEQSEKLFNDFFLAVKDILRKPDGATITAHDYRQAEKDLQQKFFEKKDQIHASLCDSIDTAAALQHMHALIKQSNVYIGSVKLDGKQPNHSVLTCIAKYLTRLLKIFGACNGHQDIGFGSVDGGNASVNREDMVMPYVDVLAKFREEVRQIARAEKVTGILKLCDDLRDNQLVELGVLLEDQEASGGAVVKLVDRETILKERRKQEEEQERKRKQKEELKLKQAQEKAAKDAKAKIPPSELFINETEKYSKFDDTGLPTHDASGEKITASAVKKLKKLQAQQEKLHKKYLDDKA